MKKIHMAIIGVAVLVFSCVGFMQLGKAPSKFEHVDVPLKSRKLTDCLKSRLT